MDEAQKFKERRSETAAAMDLLQVCYQRHKLPFLRPCNRQPLTGLYHPASSLQSSSPNRVPLGGCANAWPMLQTHGDRRRWVMTGTPIQNTPEELFSYLRFLRYSPFDDLKAFNDVFRKGNTATKIARLAAIVKPVMLRRTKRSKIDGVPILTLPRK